MSTDKQQDAQDAQQKKETQRKARDTRALERYNRANGSMSVRRRCEVIRDPLLDLGFDGRTATDIALDAPLDSSMTDAEALHTALRYADVRAQSGDMGNEPGEPGASPEAQETPTELPPDAQAQLAYLDEHSGRPGMAFSAGRFTRRVGLRLLNKGADKFDSFAKATADKIKPFANWAGNRPVPGGLGSLFMVNLLFLFIAVPANAQGYTRAQLLWLTLMNKTKLEGETTSDPVPDSPIVDAVVAVGGAIEDVASSIGNAFGVFGNAAGAAGNFIGSIFGTIGNHIFGNDITASELNDIIYQIMRKMNDAQTQQIWATWGKPPDFAKYNVGNETQYISDAKKWLKCLFDNYGSKDPTGATTGTGGTQTPQPVSAPPTNTGRNAPPPSNIIMRSPTQTS